MENITQALTHKSVKLSYNSTVQRRISSLEMWGGCHDLPLEICALLDCRDFYKHSVSTEFLSSVINFVSCVLHSVVVLIIGAFIAHHNLHGIEHMILLGSVSCSHWLSLGLVSTRKVGPDMIYGLSRCWINCPMCTQPTPWQTQLGFQYSSYLPNKYAEGMSDLRSCEKKPN